MKKYKVVFLGDKKICLEKQDNTPFDRVEQCNELIRLIASNSRCFFKNKADGTIASFRMTYDEKLIYFDYYAKKGLTKTSSSDFYKWKGGSFTGGNTLQSGIMQLSNYIKTGIPFMLPWMSFENWGYDEKSIEELKLFGTSEGIFTTNTRYRFWSHSQENENDVIKRFFEKYFVDINKCIIVRVEPNQVAPNYVAEYNFYHACSIV